MEAKAQLNYLRISPRKVQIVLDLIRGKDAKLAMAILKHTPKAASEPLAKLLKSAMANAENNHNIDPESLYVSTCYVCPGPDPEADSSQSTGKSLPGAQENIPRYHRSQRKGKLRGG